MNTTNKIQEGGLVLKTGEIMTILNEPDSVGVAFGVHHPGTAPNVDLKIYKVIELNGNLLGQERTLSYKKGASSVSDFDSDVDNFQFQFLDELVNCQFDFSFMEKSDFLDLFKDQEEEVFIVGGLKHYGNLIEISGDWFTFSISPRLNPANESPKLLGRPPKIVHLEGCPPVWTVSPITKENLADKYQICFNKRFAQVKG